jgi:hypothetical protein
MRIEKYKRFVDQIFGVFNEKAYTNALRFRRNGRISYGQNSGFPEQIETLLPTIEHRCSEGCHGGFFFK